MWGAGLALWSWGVQALLVRMVSRLSRGPESVELGLRPDARILCSTVGGRRAHGNLFRADSCSAREPTRSIAGFEIHPCWDHGQIGPPSPAGGQRRSIPWWPCADSNSCFSLRQVASICSAPRMLTPARLDIYPRTDGDPLPPAPPDTLAPAGTLPSRFSPRSPFDPKPRNRRH